MDVLHDIFQMCIRDSDNVNLTLEKGEVYGLIGRNGAGKTTLIKVITKLIRPSQGSISLFHSTSKSEWTHALKRVGSVIDVYKRQY